MSLEKINTHDNEVLAFVFIENYHPGELAKPIKILMLPTKYAVVSYTVQMYSV